MITRTLGAVFGLFLLAASASAQTSGTLTAAEATVRYAVGRGDTTASITVTGTYSGTVSFEVLTDPRLGAQSVDCGTFVAPGTAVNSTTSTGAWVCPTAGASVIQARMSSYGSGTAAVTIIPSNGAGQSVAAGGGGGSFDGVLLDAAGGDPLTDTANNALKVNVVAGAAGTATSDADDASIAAAQTNSNVNALNMWFDGTVWRRLTFGTAGTASAQVLTVQGIASMTPILATVTATNLDVQIGGSDTLTVASHAVTNAGTFAVQAAQSGTWTVQPGNTANTTAWLFTGGLSANGAAAATNRLGTLPAVVQNSAPSLTDGRDAGISLTTGGAARVMITNAAGAASTLASDAVFGTATYTEATTTGPISGGIRNDTPDSLANTTNEAAPLGLSQNGALWTSDIDPCSYRAKSVFVVNVSTATTTEIANAVASEFFYICSVNLVAAAAQTVAIVEDDTDGVGSPTAGLAGGTSAATGWSFAANGGLTLGNGSATVMKTGTANRYLGFITGQAAQISGTIVYVSAP